MAVGILGLAAVGGAAATAQGCVNDTVLGVPPDCPADAAPEGGQTDGAAATPSTSVEEAGCGPRANVEAVGNAPLLVVAPNGTIRVARRERGTCSG